MVEQEQDAVLGVCPARGGSVRVPRKNIKPLGGKPLIAWTIEAENKYKRLDYFLVSTNDEEMAKISRKLGAPVPFKRPEKISTDCDSVLVLKHAVEKFEERKGKRVGYVVCLQATSPFRTAADIDECIRIAQANPNIESVISFKKASEHPYWCFQQKPFCHEVEPFLPEIRMEGDVLVSQNLPYVLYPNGAIYVVKRDVIMSNRIYGKTIYPYLMPEERSIDLETEKDFMVASALLPVIQSDEPYTKTSWRID
jgi:CMP-N,N'-diacetyllegionaminic acid synthase